MDWSLFIHFRSVARLNHLGRAAEELGVTQPTLSRTIHALEARYGLPLFDRHGRTVRLNDSGRVLLEYVERALRALDDADRAMGDLGVAANARLTVGFIGTLGSRTIPAIVRASRAEQPAVDVRLYQGSQPDLLNRLRDSTLDVALTSAGESTEIFAWHKLFVEELWVQVHPGHRFAHRADIDLAELHDEPLVALRADTALRQITETLFAQAGVTPKIVCEGQNIVTARGLVAAGLGIMLGPILEEVPRDGVVVVRVARPVCTRPVGLSWVKERYRSTSSRQFCDAVIRAYSQQAPTAQALPETAVPEPHPRV